MRVITKNIEYPSRSSVVKLIPLGDFHLGNALCDEKGLQEVVKRIASDPLCYTGLMGDMMDCINRSDPRFRESWLAPWLQGEVDVIDAQKRRLSEILAPIKDKILWSVRGNHEALILHRYERDVYAALNESLGASKSRPLALGAQGFVRLRFKRVSSTGAVGNVWQVIVYVHHGYGGGGLEGGKALKLGRLPKAYQADIYLMGHTHSKQCVPMHRVAVAPQANRVLGKNIWTCYTGGFLRTYNEKGKAESYAEERGYSPLPTGYIEISIRPNKNRIHVEH